MACAPEFLGGSFSLLVTPFTPQGHVDRESYRRLLAYHLAAGSRGIFAVCGTAEMAALSEEERLSLAADAVRTAGKLPVVATANLVPDAAAQPAEVARMAATGVAAVVLVPPRQHDGNADALYTYFAALARTSPVPVLLYEWPGSRPAQIPAAVYAALVGDTPVAGIKDTTCTHAGIGSKIRAAPQGAVFQANSPLLPAALQAGARGAMTITSAVRPDLIAALCEAVAEGRAGAAALARENTFLDAVLALQHPAGAKWLLCRMGVIRYPTTRLGRPLSDPEIAALEAWSAGAPSWYGPAPWV